jgi:MinD superfamily P-loop ATPase
VIISVASGKGGTGKTTVAVGLALSLPEISENCGDEGIPILLKIPYNK